MTDIPIIFSAPMVRALLDGRKTMTRRLLYTKRKMRANMANVVFLRDHPPPLSKLGPDGFPTDIGPNEYWALSPWQKVKPGTLIWVKETHYRYGKWVKDGKTKTGRQRWRFRARVWNRIPDGGAAVRFPDQDDFEAATSRTEVGWHKRPSIFMPRWASRLTLTVTATKIERLQDISEADAKAEGCGLYVAGHGWITEDELRADPGYSNYLAPRLGFEDIWRQLHGDDAWAANPEVMVIGFSVALRNIDAEATAA